MPLDRIGRGDRPRERRDASRASISLEDFEAAINSVPDAYRQRPDDPGNTDSPGPAKSGKDSASGPEPADSDAETADAASQPDASTERNEPANGAKDPDTRSEPDVADTNDSDAATADSEADKSAERPGEAGAEASQVTADSPAEPGEMPPYSELFDTPDANGQTPREAVRAVKPEDLGVTGFTPERTDAYFAAYRDKHRWLKACESAQPESRYLLAILDQGPGHALSRHEGHASGDNLSFRVEQLQDPANMNKASRLRAEDAYEKDAMGLPKRHRCEAAVTAITDPNAFATAWARAMQHPQVRAALATPSTLDRPDPVKIPIDQILGPNGHEHCEGRQLPAINGNLKVAAERRTQWVKDRLAGQLSQSDASSPPTSDAIESFAGGSIVCSFLPRDGRYVLATLYPEAPKPKES